MLRIRNLKRSIRSHIEGVLTSGSYGLTAFNVYGESDLRAGTEPTFPYVFLVESAIMPTATELPMLVLEVSRVGKRTFELGNRDGRELNCFVHILGANRGQRDDLSALLQEGIGQVITVYDFSSGSAVPDGTRIELREDVDVLEAPPINDELRAEGTVLNMSIVSFTGVTTL